MPLSIRRYSSLLVAITFLAAAGASLSATAQSSDTVRIRGTLVRVDASTLVVQDRGGEVVSLARPADLAVSEVYPIKLSDIRRGSFIGTAAMPQPDGTQKALEVVVFPEAARGTGEGHRPWDLLPQSTMTNATVADLAAAPKSVRGGQQLHLTYKGGEKTVIVPPHVPVVTFRPGTDALLVPGARVLVNAQEKNGTPTALRVTAGRNGFAPPM
ncbi:MULTISPECIES: hypothetical protein [unclassified Variovorax]|jgi:hypothetical protein|uniref:hypothetical protein n=1 Tax=unclassified Variovorax TaxID=663243 RepID=UPI000F7D8330|nr:MULTISPECIES: hypothetical protein [unclassified Variovorax]RSZ41261.1 hypothetical protein EJO70_15420 [Variovorax sp. 553]RSZ41831.1 hypothetical protein EJO71_13620 [Variovorax sp. 679]